MNNLSDGPIGVWKSIEVAPKDGTNILLTNGEEVVTGYWGSWPQPFSQVANTWCSHWPVKCGPPTHWMPLPDPPRKDHRS
jgi:uncharacterized protein DUF551